MEIQFQEGSNILTFQTVGSYNTKQVTVNDKTVELSGIETTVANLQIEIDSGLTSNIEISDFTFGKSCWIGSSLKSCEYDSKGTLTIKSSQSSPFKFNKINISGDNGAINRSTGVIIINSDDYKLTISGISYGISNYGTSITINNSGIININNNNYGIYNKGTITINNPGTIIINNSNRGIFNEGTMTINNPGTIDIITNNVYNGIYNSYGEMTIYNSGSMTINSSNHGFYNNGTITFDNSSIINFSCSISIRGNTNINISDSLFLIESSNTPTSINFRSTPSTWNGRTFTNSSTLNLSGTTSLSSYFTTCTLKSGEEVVETLIEDGKVTNQTDETKVLLQGQLTFDEKTVLQNDGVVVFQPRSSIEFSEPLEINKGSSLLLSGETKINNSQILGESVVCLNDSSLDDLRLESAVAVV